jgi:chromosome segregation ATPase
MADIMVKILGQIRDELKTTRAELSSRLDEMSGRIGETNGRLDDLQRRRLETEVRLSTEIVSVVAAIGELKAVIVEDRKLRSQVRDHETRIKALERKKAS